ncbi:MAG: DUF6115 domain-containing protein [Ruminococcus flavefaciens]|nr:DUF6115 domain-containing protein [Ruminococcus flavefaciens]
MNRRFMICYYKDYGMETIEIVLLVAGGIIFILSFLIPGKRSGDAGGSKQQAREEVSELVKQEMESVRTHVDDVVDEAVTYAMEKTERSLERLSNEKIMAVNEYSDTVLAEIHKNHEEAMFLYDMLNSKHSSLKNTVSEVNRTVKEAEKTVTSFRSLKPELLTAEETDASDAQPTEPKRRIEAVRPTAAEAAFVSLTPTEKTPEPEALGDNAALEESVEEGGNNNRKILELYRQGQSKVMIARELGLGVGEVKLVIDLFRNQAQAR